MSNPSNLPYPESLRAMSIHFPHAWAIVHGRKDGEYRSRLTRYRGMVLIHASGSQDSDDYLVDYNIPPQQIVRKAILGAVDLFDCVEDPWQPGYIYRLRNPIVFKKPIPAAGQQSPFWPASTPERDKAFRQAWQQVHRVLDPTAIFQIVQEKGLIRISSQKTQTSFLVEDGGLWDSLLPDIQNGTIQLSKSTFANLYRSRIEPA